MTGFPKPARGTQTRERAARSRRAGKTEQSVKDQAKERDGEVCRWPHQSGLEAAICRSFGSGRVEVAHTTHKGMGGDKKLLRTKRELLITFGPACHAIYDGRNRSDKKPNRRVVFLTPEKTDGPCAFEVLAGDKWVEIARETAVAVLEKKRRP